MEDPEQLADAIEVAIDRTHKAEGTFAEALDVGASPPVSLADVVHHRADDVAELTQDAAEVEKSGERQKPPRADRQKPRRAERR
jgi:hypothetical protein